MITAVNDKCILEMSAADASTLMTGKHNSTVTVTVHRGEGTDAKTITGVPTSSFCNLQVLWIACLGMPVYICSVTFMGGPPLSV